MQRSEAGERPPSRPKKARLLKSGGLGADGHRASPPVHLRGEAGTHRSPGILVLPAGASAHGGDRDHDKLPDRWEKRHGLSVKVAIEHGLTLCSVDTDFARFRELRWHNPLRAA